MPMFVEGQDPRDFPDGFVPPAPAQPPDPFYTPSPDKVVESAFRQTNPIASVLSSIASQSPDHTPDPDWNPLTAIKGTPYEQYYLNDFLGDQNEAQTRARMAKISAEENDRQTVAASGWAGTVANLAATGTDIFNYIPILGEVAKGAGVARTILGTAGSMAATGAVSSAASEAALQQTQQTRTAEESAGNIASGTLLMGLLGAGVGGVMARGETRQAASDLDTVRKDLSPAGAPAPAIDTAAHDVAPPVPPAEAAKPQVATPAEDEVSEFHPTPGRFDIPQSVLSGEPDNALGTIFGSEHYDGTHVPLTNLGFDPHDVQSLHEAGLVDHEGAMSAGQFADYERARASAGAPPREEPVASSEPTVRNPPMNVAGERMPGEAVHIIEPGAPAVTEAERGAGPAPAPETPQGTLTPEEILQRPEVQQAIQHPRAIDRTHDVPYLAGSSNSGGVTYIDSSIPPKVKIGRKNVDVAKYLNIHEQTEHALMIEGKMPYEAAHRIATEHEIAAVRADGVNVQKYNDFMDGHLAKTEKESGKPKNFPPDLYTKPYPHTETEIIKREEAGEHTFGNQPAHPVEVAARALTDRAKAALEASGTEFDKFAHGVITQHVEPFIDETFPKAPVAEEAAPDEKINAETLLAYLKRMGGIKDYGGELKARGMSRAYPGLVNNRRGMELDDARAAAAQQGYLGGHPDVMASTTVNDLLDALTSHPRYSIHDMPEVQRAGDAAAANVHARRVEDAAQTIDAHLAGIGEKPLDKEWRTMAAEIYRGQDEPNIDAAIESAAIRLYERDTEQARLHREEPQIPEFVHEAAAIDKGDRVQGDEGAYFGDRPRAEGDVGAARGEVQPHGEIREEGGFEAVRDRIRQAYLDASGGKLNQRVFLSDIRSRLPDLPRAEVDDALRKMHLDQNDSAFMSGSDNPPELRIGDRRAGMLDFKGEPMSVMHITKDWREPESATNQEPTPATEAGPEGTRQTLVPGVAPVTDADRARLGAQAPLRGGTRPPPEGGLFDAGARMQRDMFDTGASDMQQVEALVERDREENRGVPIGQAAGAAAADTRTLKLKNYGVPSWLKGVPYAGPGAEAVGNVLNKFSPTLRVFSSESVQAKRLMADMAETPLLFEDNARGLPTSHGGPPLDRLVKTQSRQLQMATNHHLEEQFVAYRYGTTPPRSPMQQAGVEDLRGLANGKMSFSQFKAAVSEALYSGDEHVIPQVQMAAQHLRRDVIDPVARMAQNVKGPDGKPMLAEELAPPPGDKSYAPRVWNKEALAAKRNEAREIFTNYYENDQATKAAAKDRLADLQQKHDDITSTQGKQDRRLEVLQRRFDETTNALKERGMETNRATDRQDSVQTRVAAMDEDLQEMRQALAETRQAFVGTNVLPEERAAYDTLRRDMATLQRRRDRGGARLDESGVPVDASQSRFMDLADRQTRYKSMIDLMTAARGNSEVERLATRAKMEDEINNWNGNSSREAKTALAARAEAERIRQLKKDADVYQGKGERLASADAAVDNAVRKITNSPRDLSRQELSGRADETIDRLLGSPDGRLDYDTEPVVGPPGYLSGQQLRGHLLNRTFAIPSASVKDFLEQDTQHLMSSYLRSVLPDTMLTERFGDVEMRDGFRKVNEEYASRAAGLKSEKDLIALEKERQGMIRDLAATRDRLRGVYGWSPDPRMRNAARIAGVARNWNIVADLGTSVANRLGDAGANAVFRHGFMNVMRDSWFPMLKAMTGNPTLAKAYRTQAKAMAVGVDGMLGHMAHDFGDAMANYRPGSKFERGLAWAADRSMLVNMHGPWTDWTKTMISGVASSELLKATERIARGAEEGRDIEKLAAASIDRPMATKIWKNFADGGGSHIEGVPVPNTRDWKDMDARQAFESAIGREADIAVITPGMEKPLWMSGPVAGLVGQFKSFVAGAYERLLISNMQQRDTRTLQGLLTAVATGMLSYRLYTWLSGKPASDNPSDWIKEGVHRSAILAWFSEMNEMQAKFSGGASDMYRLIGATSPLTRRDQSPLGSLLGPTYSRLEGLAGAAGDAVRGILPGPKPNVVWTAQDTHKLREVMLLQNLAGVRILLDMAEDGINSALGVPHRDKSNKVWNPRSSINAIQESTPPQPAPPE